MSDIPIVAHPLTYPKRDTAKRLVKDSGLRFPRPYIRAGGLRFTWPIGAEGFSFSGNATVGIHKYIGDNKVDAHVVHFDEGKIEVSGLLPGITSPGNARELRAILISRKKKVLFLPGILAKEEFVTVDSYEFRHTQDDKTHSMDYTVSFWRSGSGSGGTGTGPASSVDSLGINVADSPPNPQRASDSASDRSIAVTDGLDTFRLIANKVYGDTDKWPNLVDLNRESLTVNNPGIAVNPYEMGYYRWPTGTRIKY